MFVISATSTGNTSTDSSNMNLAAELKLSGPTRSRGPVLNEKSEPEVVTHADDTVLEENDVGVNPDDSPPVIA